jgi:DNA-binding FrmR family transcriptional regulator
VTLADVRRQDQDSRHLADDTNASATRTAADGREFARGPPDDPLVVRFWLVVARILPAGILGGDMSESTVPVHGYSADREALIKRLHRIEGQVRGVEKMLADDRYCIDIITQISAVTTALEAVAFRILDDHVNHCVTGALASGDEEVAAEKSRELLDAVHRFARAR